MVCSNSVRSTHAMVSAAAAVRMTKRTIVAAPAATMTTSQPFSRSRVRRRLVLIEEVRGVSNQHMSKEGGKRTLARTQRCAYLELDRCVEHVQARHHRTHDDGVQAINGGKEVHVLKQAKMEIGSDEIGSEGSSQHTDNGEQVIRSQWLRCSPE